MTELLSYLSMPTVRYALIVGALVSLCSALLGVPLVLKRFSYIGDGLSHVAFGAMAVAAVVGLTDNMLIIMPVTIVCAILLLAIGPGSRIHGDAALAMLSVTALSFGYLLLNRFPGSGNVAGDVCSSLFGSSSLITLRMSDVWLSMALSVLVLVFFIFFYPRVFAVSFDPSFMQATGGRAKAYNLALAVVCAVVISFSMRLVGSLLISALVIFPAVTAMSLWKSFRSVTVGAAFFGVGCALAGMLLSIVLGTPVGATIVASDAVVFFCVRAVLLFRK